MIELKNVRKQYKVKDEPIVNALDNVSCKINDKGLIFILGKSGSGKSTMLNLIGGLDRPDEGEIIIDGVSLKDFDRKKYDSYRNSLVGFIFQEYNVLNEFNVEDNIALALKLQSKKSTEDEINKILKKVDLEGLGKRKMNELSGGQTQRVAIARALVKDPEIILADEPTGALDSSTSKEIFNLLKDLSKDHLVIVVSHDREFAEDYGDRVIELADGKIISDITKVVKENETEQTSEYYYIQTTEELIESKVNDMSIKKSYVYKKNRLPWVESMHIGLSSLKAKPIQLIFVFILTILSFSCFGISLSVSEYDGEETFVNNAKCGIYEASLTGNNTSKQARNDVKILSEIKESFEKMEQEEIERLVNDKGFAIDNYVDGLYRASREVFEIPNCLGQNDLARVQKHYDLKMDKVVRPNITYSTNGFPKPTEFSPDIYKINVKDFVTFKPLDMFDLDYSNQYVFSEYFHEEELKHKDDDGEVNIEDIIDYYPYYDEENKTFKSLSLDRTKKLKSLIFFPSYPEHNASLANTYEKILINPSLNESNLLYGRLPKPNSTEICISDYTYEVMKLYGANQYLNLKDSYELKSDFMSGSSDFNENRSVYYPNRKTVTFTDWEDFKSKDIKYQLSKTIKSKANTPTVEGSEEQQEDEFTKTYELINCDIVGVIDTGFNDRVFEIISDMSNLKEGVKGNVTEFDLLVSGDLSNLLPGDNYLSAQCKNILREMDSLFKYRLSYGLSVYGDKDIIHNIVKDEPLIKENKVKPLYNQVIYTEADEPSTEYYINYYQQNNVYFLYKFIKENFTYDQVSGFSLRKGNYFDYGCQFDESIYTKTVYFTDLINFLKKSLLYSSIVLGVLSVVMLGFFINSSILFKRRQIGILRSLGASGEDIYKIFLNESYVISLISGVLSMFVSWLAVYLISRKLFTVLGFIPFTFGIVPICLIALLFILDPLIASFIPCYFISREKPIDSIRLK